MPYKPRELRLLSFYGKGGAGKDSEAERLAREHPGWAIISTGDRIKQALNPNDEFHFIVLPYAHRLIKGENLPTNVVINLFAPNESIFPAFVMAELAKGASVTTIISTGFPRTLIQLKDLDTYLKSLREKQGLKVTDGHFYFDVSDGTSLKRILGRPEEARALGKPVRHDDNEKTALRRLDTFRQDTLPAIEELKAQGRIHVVSGEGTKDQTHALVEGILFPKPALEISSGETPTPRPIRERR